MLDSIDLSKHLLWPMWPPAALIYALGRGVYPVELSVYSAMHPCTIRADLATSLSHPGLGYWSLRIHDELPFP